MDRRNVQRTKLCATQSTGAKRDISGRLTPGRLPIYTFTTVGGRHDEITRGQGSREASSRIAQGLDRGAQEIPREGEEVHPAARRARPAAARPALGEGGQAIRFRRAEGRGDAG